MSDTSTPRLETGDEPAREPSESTNQAPPPGVIDDPSAPGSPAEISAASETRSDNPATARILNVNDDAANLYSLTRILRRGGFQVEEARCGLEALDRVQSSRPDLIVLDVDLPDVDGFEVCRRIKDDPETATILVLQLSAKYVKPEDKTYGLGSGADGYLIQPVEQLELISSVRSLVRLRRAEATARASVRRIEQLEKELESLARLSTSPTAVTARVFDSVSIQESHPAVFRELVALCEKLLEQAIEQQHYKVQHDISTGLRSAADQLGYLRATPRDVVEIYRVVLKNRIAGVLPQRARGYIDEDRMLVLELMGHLLSHYRTAAIAPPVRDPPRGGTSGGPSTIR